MTALLHDLRFPPPRPPLPSLSPYARSACPSISSRSSIRRSTALGPNAALLHSREGGAVPAQPESAVSCFWQWLVDKGAVPNPATTKQEALAKPGWFEAEGLGLVAQKNIARNQVVLEIPKRLWVGLDAVAASQIGRVCGGLRPWVAIALFLLRERAMGDASSWRPYLDILPSSTDSTIFWSEAELLEIKGTQLLSTTLGVKEYVQSEFSRIESEVILPNKHLFPSPITANDLLWAFGILRSRAFSRMRGENLVLIPLADLINHSPSITSEDSAWEIKGKGLFSREILFSLRAPVPIKAGEQVYIQYDLEKSNSELALDYGFIEPRSERDAYTLTLEVADSDPFHGDKLDIAESNNLGQTAYFDIGVGYPLPPTMLPYLRLVALGGTDAFLLESIFRNSIWDHLELPISRANEEMICRVVRDACKSALSAYHTTIEEDEKLMEQGNLNRRLKIAVAVRKGEKKVLQHIDQIFRERELELDGLEYYQERRLRDLGLVGEQGDIIFWESK